MCGDDGKRGAVFAIDGAGLKDNSPGKGVVERLWT